MRIDLDQKLCDKYPKIFANRHKAPSETAMCWGFDHGDGWYDILDILCESIQTHIDWSVENHNWTNNWNLKNPDQPRPVPTICAQVVATQVKEKFGELRFYYDGGDDMIQGMVEMAQSISTRVCETCGKPGSLRGGGWVQTLCDEHAKLKLEAK
jgi:hypothetical protein